MESYFRIIDILDDITQSQREATTEEIKTMNELAKKDGEDIKQFISDLANANDCGDCQTWEDVIKAFTELWKNGERVEFNI